MGCLWTVVLVGETLYALGEASALVETDYVEHRVVAEDAKSIAATLQPHLMVGVGCKKCTRLEIAYCLSEDVVEDHCCCDRRYHEVFPYMSHTCYKRARYCQPVARDCGEYARLLACCCHRLLADKWKSQSGSASLDRSSWFFPLIVFTVLASRC